MTMSVEERYGKVLQAFKQICTKTVGAPLGKDHRKNGLSIGGSQCQQIEHGQPDQRMKERRPVRRGVPDVGNDAIVDDRFEQIRGSQT